jgi:hypothetical protein
MESILFTLFFVALFFIGLLALRYTPFEISFRRGNFTGLFIYREIFMLIAPGVVMLNYFGTHRFSGLANTTHDSIFPISIFIVSSLIVFIVVTGLVSRILLVPLRKTARPSFVVSNPSDLDDKIRKLTFSVVLLGVVVSIVAMVGFGARHAFLNVLFAPEGESVLRSIRGANRYATGMPTVFWSLMQFCYIIIASLLGTQSFDKKRILLLLFMAVGVYIATFPGSKAPLLKFLIIFGISYVSFHTIRLNVKFLFKALFSLAIFAAALIFVVTSQFSDMDVVGFFNYLLNRLGVGQIAGVYEQFNLQITNIDYIWHAVPFANFVMDYPTFHKDLMVISESVHDPTRTGVKNSLFISEAYGIGGAAMALLSPFIVGISYAVSFFCFWYAWRRFLLKNYVISMKICGLIFVSFLSLTGGFSEWLFLKAMIMLLCFTAVVYSFRMLISPGIGKIFASYHLAPKQTAK